MPAAEAAETEIHAGTQHLPAFFAAGVCFFHDEDIVNADIHCKTSNFSPRPKPLHAA